MSNLRLLMTLVTVLAVSTSGCGGGSESGPASRESLGTATVNNNAESTVPVADVLGEPAAATVSAAATDRELSSAPRSHRILFKRSATERQLSHTYQSGATGKLLMVESIGGGLGWLDAERDGLMDLFCVQGGNPAVRDVAGNSSDQLFRQLSSGHYSSVTNVAGIDDRAYGQGVTIGDFDNDGFEDIYITNVGRNQLLHNCGDGTFTPSLPSPCVSSERWSSSAAWADTDVDGDLDLYVCNYLKYDPLNPLPCEKNGLPALCHPRQIEAWPDEFFENQGDGTFISVSTERGLIGDGNKALGVVVADLSGDGWPDIYVANDTTANFYFVNRQDGRFDESSLQLGGGLNASGAMQASMGVAAGDYDRSGTTDIFLTHFTGESNTLYQNLQGLGLHDVSGKTGLFPISNSKLGFGTVMCDFDANGQLDLVVANGHIDSNNADGDGFMQHSQLLTFDGKRWGDVSDSASDYFAETHVGRGIALGDFDGDGDPDLAIANQNEPLELLENISESGNWLKVVPIPTSSNRSAIGTSATVRLDSGSWSSAIYGGTSFCASHEHAMFFGFGDAGTLATVTVTWPGGQQTVVDAVELNQILTVREP